MVMDDNKIAEELRRIRWLLTLSLVLSTGCLIGVLWLMVGLGSVRHGHGPSAVREHKRT